STLNESGTDSTEEEKPEDEEDVLRLGIDCMRAQADSRGMNPEYEVSTLNIDDNELIKILIDPLVSGDAPIAENTLAKIVTTHSRQSSSTSHSLKTLVADTPYQFFKEHAISSAVPQADATLDTS
ncbi:hypothetical protein BGZ98_006906, partial [Dissophora globulifera]